MPFRRKNGKTTREELLLYQYKIMNTKKKRVRSRLEALGKEYDIDHDYDTLHDALSDLQLNIKVWNKLKLQTDI
jgi:DNA polymerase III epsilon subunit-like protein